MKNVISEKNNFWPIISFHPLSTGGFCTDISAGMLEAQGAEGGTTQTSVGQVLEWSECDSSSALWIVAVLNCSASLSSNDPASEAEKSSLPSQFPCPCKISAKNGASPLIFTKAAARDDGRGCYEWVGEVLWVRSL